MSNYVSDYSGSQIDNIIGLFNGKGLNQVTGLVQRNADGTFSQGSGSGGVTDVTVDGSSVVVNSVAQLSSKDYFIPVYTWYEGDATSADFAELKAAIEAKKSIYLDYSFPDDPNEPINYAPFTDVKINGSTTIKGFIISNMTQEQWEFYSDGTCNFVYTLIQERLVSGTNIKTINNTSLLGSGNISIATPTVDQTYNASSTNAQSGVAVASAIAELPTPMQFKGSVGTSGTVTWTNLATAAAANSGYVYKVITDHSAETGKPAAKEGDTIVSNGSEWVVIPSGDEPSGTVTSIATGSGLSGGPITSSGTISLATAFGDTVNPYGSKTANYVLAAPNGEAGVPAFRALVAADLPNGNWLNGSAPGSVRTSGSTAENSEYTIGQYAVAEGVSTKASGGYSHAEGHTTTASGYYSHAEGASTTASGYYSHAEGYYTTASGDYSHAEGYYTTASEDYSHASGCGTTAQQQSQTVIGKYNVLDSSGNYAFIIGKGLASFVRSNALTVDWDGNLQIAGALKDMSGNNLIPTRGTATSGGTTLSVVNTGDMYTWNNKQDALVSGTNIKTINNTSLLGSGNISITDTTYTAGTGIDITNGVISLSLTAAEQEGF